MRGYISISLKIIVPALGAFMVVWLEVVKVFYNREEYVIVEYSADIKMLVPGGGKIDIDVYRVLNETHKLLSKDDISSEVFAFNNMKGDVYKYKNQDFYDILSIAKEVFMCSDGKISPVRWSGSLDSILINKTTAKKLKGDVNIDLDDCVGACVLKQIARQGIKQKIQDYCLQYEDDLLLCGNQNRKTPGWNISKQFKYVKKKKHLASKKTEEKEEPVYSIPYEFEQYVTIEYKDPVRDILSTNMLHDDDGTLERDVVERTVTLHLAGMKDKALCFIKPDKEKNIIGGVIITDDLFLSRAVGRVVEQNGFAGVDTISSRLRYHDCQYFILYYNHDGVVEHQKSFGLEVKEKDNCWRVSFYGR